MTSLAAVHAVLPPHRYPQDKITEAFGEHVLGATKGHEVVRRIHTNTRVGGETGLGVPSPAAGAQDHRRPPVEPAVGDVAQLL